MEQKATARARWCFSASAALAMLLAPADCHSAESGTYVGNGVDNRLMDGLGFAPDVVIIKGDTNEYACCRTSSMSGDASKRLGAATALVSNRIQSLTSDGFTLGNDDEVNRSGRDYYWIAFKAAADILAVGSYTGNGVNNTNITTVGFKPDYAVVMAATNRHAIQRSDLMPANNSIAFDSVAGAGNKLLGFIGPGFRLGSHADVNASGVTYYYAAWKATALEVSIGSYVGDGVDNRVITGLGYRPEYVMVKRWSSTSGVHRPASLGTSASALRFSNNANLADSIQQIAADGFEVGRNSTVNSSGTTYYWTAFGPRGPRILAWEEAP
jgi:hypothetical protein